MTALALNPMQDAIFIDEAAATSCGEACGGFFSMDCLGVGGLDSVEFFLSSGPNDTLRPLSSVASGGESARILLALKAAPALMAGRRRQQGASSSGGDEGGGSGEGGTWPAAAAEAEDAAGDQAHSLPLLPRIAAAPAQTAAPSAAAARAVNPVLILDEIDSGVGSRLGTPLGRILRRMVEGGGGDASPTQILCVSHLPQVAAHADHHICVRKSMTRGDSGRAITSFEHLSNYEARLQEVAAMAGLAPDAAHALMQAAQRG